MNLAKTVEILSLNVKTGGKKMPPDVKDALDIAVICTEYWHTRFLNSPLTEEQQLEHIIGLTKAQRSAASLKGGKQ